MNGERILNLPEPVSPSEPARLSDIQDIITGDIFIGPDAGSLTGSEEVPIKRGTSVLKTTLTAIGSWVLQTFQGFTQSGAGTVARTVQDKAREIVSIKDFGAIADWNGSTGTDNTSAIQAALNYANSIGGAIVYIPTGKYRKGDTAGTQLIMYSNTTIRGDGDSSVIIFDDKDTVPRSGNDFLVADNTSNIAFEDFKIEGTALTYTNETNQKQCLTGLNIDGFYMRGVTITKTRFMATAFGNIKNVRVIGNRLDYIVRDGLRFTNAENVTIVGNVLTRVTDDAIAVHTLDSSTTPSSGTVISDNVLEACQGIKTLGGKTITIRGNILRRMLRNPIIVSLPMSGTEGNTPVFSVDVSGNTVLDSFGNRGTNYAIRISVDGGRTNGGLGTVYPGVNSIPYPYNYANNIDTGGANVNLGAIGIRVHGNTIARTLPSGSAYSAWGYGPLFDRTTVNFISDPVIAEADLTIHGLNVVAPVSGMSISSNHISGCGLGFTAIFLQVSGTTNVQDYTNVLVSNNQIVDCPGIGIGCSAVGSGTGGKQLLIQNNLFDLDPFFRAGSHNADNTWSSVGSVVAISVSNTIGWVAGGNTFKNCGQTGLANNVTTEWYPNIVYSDFVGAGDNASNKGVRQLPQAAMNLIIPINGDPTAATFGQIANTVNTRSGSIPITGRYVQGHRVLKDTPTVTGAGGSQYTVTGWWRLTTGNAHVLNTDWVEMRTLTGT